MKTFNLAFTQDQLVVLNEAVIELPFKKAQPLIAHINAEIQKSFDAAVDARDMPSGQTSPPDLCRGD